MKTISILSCFLPGHRHLRYVRRQSGRQCKRSFHSTAFQSGALYRLRYPQTQYQTNKLYAILPFHGKKLLVQDSLYHMQNFETQITRVIIIAHIPRGVAAFKIFSQSISDFYLFIYLFIWKIKLLLLTKNQILTFILEKVSHIMSNRKIIFNRNFATIH